MKFKVGDKVERKNCGVHDTGTVELVMDKSLSHPYEVRFVGGIGVRWSREDELELVEGDRVQPEVKLGPVDSFAAWTGKSTPAQKEPIPGKFYRTRGGDKTLYVGKNRYGLSIYENSSGEYMHYRTPTQYYVSVINIDDIVGEWVDEVVLPAVEIKRWSLICNEDYKHWKRGEFRFADNSIQEIEKVLNVYVEKEERKYWEIVELTGTLPERKG